MSKNTKTKIYITIKFGLKNSKTYFESKIIQIK